MSVAVFSPLLCAHQSDWIRDPPYPSLTSPQLKHLYPDKLVPNKAMPEGSRQDMTAPSIPAGHSVTWLDSQERRARCLDLNWLRMEFPGGSPDTVEPSSCPACTGSSRGRSLPSRAIPLGCSTGPGAGVGQVQVAGTPRCRLSGCQASASCWSPSSCRKRLSGSKSQGCPRGTWCPGLTCSRL